MIESSNLSSSGSVIRDITPRNASSSSVIDAGLQGLNSSRESLIRSAQTVTFSTVSGGDNQSIISEADIQSALVDQIRSQQVFNASAQVVSVADENIGSLIDTIA